ncbi:MAG: helix-turn-helix domain-containing protein, partial [Desulfuromonas sp.]
AAALQGLQNFTWPGNVRELENTVQRACLLSQNQVLQLSDFPVLRDQSDPVEDDGLETLIANKLRSALLQKEIEEINDLYTMVLEQMERPLLRIVLEKTRGNQLRAAEVLGINRNTLRKKIRLLGLETGRNDGVTTEPT